VDHPGPNFLGEDLLHKNSLTPVCPARLQSKALVAAEEGEPASTRSKSLQKELKQKSLAFLPHSFLFLKKKEYKKIPQKRGR
jgi:hypothetical protein